MHDPNDTPKASEPSIDIRSPGLVEACDSVESMHMWELLRRSGTPLTTAELAKIGSMPARTVQRALDRFEAVELVRRHVAESRQPVVRWSVTRQVILVHHRALEAEDQALFARMAAVFGTDSENEILRAVKPQHELGRGDNNWQSVIAASLNNDEMRELWGKLIDLERFLHRCNNKFKNVAPDAIQDCNYYIGVRLMPLLPGVLPMPSFNFLNVESPALGMLSESLAGEASDALTARELAVARALAAGKTSRDVAAENDISVHTVVEYTRRIYRKLGVKSRSQLATRLSKA
jgi:DNA-binding CsgD family transcriptional regulator/DNA-binding MarR family transcriptional regulator